MTGHEIREFRKAKKKTQAEFADIFMVSVRTIQRAEADEVISESLARDFREYRTRELLKDAREKLDELDEALKNDQ